MSDLQDLMAKLEGASEGSRELDFAIAKEIGWKFHGEKEFKEWGLFWRDSTTEEWKQLPWWTTSLDAALTLVPKGWVTMHAGQNPVSGTWYWGLHKQAEAGINDGCCQQTESQDLFTSAQQTNSAPIALCIAALKVLQK